MKLVERKSGKIIDVPDDQAEGLFKSGMYGFLPGASVPVSTPGITGTVAAPDAQAAFAGGANIPSEADFRAAQMENRHSGLGGGLEAAGVGALRGGAEAFGVPFDAAALGAADTFADSVDIDDPYRGRMRLTGKDRLRNELEGLQRVHPYASQAGELAGLVGAGIATGGESFLGEVGAAGEGVARTLGAGRIGQGVARGIAEGGPLGAINAVNEAALGNTDVTAEKVVAGMGHGAFMGAGLGAAFSGLGVAKDAARNQFGRFAEKLAPKDVEALAEKTFGYAPEGLGDKVARAYTKAAASVSGKDAETIGRFTALTPEGAEARRVAVFDAPTILEDAQRDFRTHVDDIMSANAPITDEARGELKAAQVDRSVKKGNEADTRAFTVDELDKIIAGATEQLEHPGGVAPTMKGKLKSLRELAQRARAAAFGGGDVDPDLRWKWHHTGKPSEGLKTVMVDTAALDSAWSMDRGYYIGEGEEGIGGRRKGFQDWRAKNPEAPIEAPRINVDPDDGRANFIDGRHRFAELRDAGVHRVAVTLPEYDLKRLGPEWNVGPLAEENAATTKNGQYFTALDKMKRALQRSAKSSTKGVNNIADPLDYENALRALDWLKGSAEGVRAGLEDENLWGKAAANQREINAAWTRQLAAQRRFRGALTTEVGRDPRDPYRDLLGADPKKVASYVQGLTNPHNDLTHAAVKDYVASTRDLADSIAKSLDLPPEALAEVARLKGAAEGFDKTLATAEKTVTTANQYRELTQGSKDSLAGLLGAVGVGGLPGAALGAVSSAVSNPGRMVAQLAAVERLALKVDTRVGSSIRDFFRGASRRPAPALEAEVASSKGFDDQIKLLSENVDADGNITPAGRDRIANAVGELGEGAPKLATAVAMKAMQIATFLAGKVPPAMRSPYEMFPGEEPPLVSDSERETFARYVAAANDPMSVVDHLAKGDVTPEEAETLDHCYPRLYEEIADQIDAVNRAAQAKGKPLDYEKKVSYGNLFKVRTDATMDPEVLQAVAVARQKRKGGQMGPGLAPTRLKGAPSLAGRFATNFDAAASSRRRGGF